MNREKLKKLFEVWSYPNVKILCVEFWAPYRLETQDVWWNLSGNATYQGGAYRLLKDATNEHSMIRVIVEIDLPGRMSNCVLSQMYSQTFLDDDRNPGKDDFIRNDLTNHVTHALHSRSIALKLEAASQTHPQPDRPR